ncbi:MAG: transketolase C-terminal domain-containing protein [Bacteroidota bacterium]
MPLSYNLNTYSLQTLENWLSLIYHNQHLQESIQHYFQQENIPKHYPLNNRLGYLKLAAGNFFNNDYDYQFLMPGDLLQALASGLTDKEILALCHNKVYDKGNVNIFSPLHFFNEGKHLLPISGREGTHAATATGLARSLKIYNSEGIVLCPISQAALHEGLVYESILAADNERLPVLFMINGYETEETTFDADLFGRLPGTYLSYCDNTNFFDTMNATQKAFRVVKEEKLPVLLAAKGQLKSEDLFDDYTDLLIGSRKFTKEGIRSMGQEIQAKIDLSYKTIISLTEPSAEKLAKEKQSLSTEYNTEKEDAHRKLALSDAIAETLSEQLTANRHSFHLSGIVCQQKNLNAQTGIDSPKAFHYTYSPEFLVTSAAGMCYYRKDLMVTVLPAADASEIWNLAGRLADLTALAWHSQNPFRLLIRVPVGGYDGSGPFLSQKPETALASIPGVQLVYPAFADDAAGLIRTAFETPGITIMFESKALYDDPLSRKAIHPTKRIKPGSSRILRKGKDITFITWGNTVHLADKAASKMLSSYGIQAEVIDLRSIVPYDKETILRSVKKTRRVLIIHESYTFAGIGSEIASMINREAYAALKAPVGKAGTHNSPVPYQREAEALALPSISGITDEALNILEF